MECMFNEDGRIDHIVVELYSQAKPKKYYFRYLGSITACNGGMEEDVVHRIHAGWLKWRNAPWVL